MEYEAADEMDVVDPKNTEELYVQILVMLWRRPPQRKT